MSLVFNDFKKGRGLWKFNNSLLYDNDYLECIRDFILQVKKHYALPVYNINNLHQLPDENILFTINDQLFLETLLMEIRGKTISYSSYIKKKKDKQEKELVEEIKDIEKNISESNVDLLYNKNQELEKLRKHKLQGNYIRSRAKWIEEGEKPSSYFCKLESRNFIRKIIPKLELDSGEVIYDQTKILTETKSFYTKLYENKLDNVNFGLNNELIYADIPKLSETESDSLEGEITFSEASKTLSSMKANKSPGSGFSSEFLKVFWKYIGVFVVRSINYGYKNNILSVTQRHGVITLLPKGDKARHYIKNWRPITLLNTVYKIASGCIAARLKKYLHKIINPDQTGFMSNRYIGENTRLIYDIMQYTEDEEITGLLLLIDFEKAFDTLSWNFIQQTLDFFNFGPTIRQWVKIFYTNITSAVNQGGNLSEIFNIQRGCRQGDPLSPYIFLICAEILAIQIRKNEKIKGITVGNIEKKDFATCR